MSADAGDPRPPIPGGPILPGPVRADAGRDRRLAIIVTLGVMGFVGLALAKPWGGAIAPAPSVAPSAMPLTGPPASLPTTAPAIPSIGPRAIGPAFARSFTTPAPSAVATWIGLRWSRLDQDDPLDLVAAVRTWRGGYVAVGWEGLPPRTPVWTSLDARRWSLLPPATSTTFWPDQVVGDVVEARGGLVAITEAAQYCVEPCQLSFQQPVVAWTSRDGRTWRPHGLPPGWLPETSRRLPLLTAGPAGLVLASTGPRARLATSVDGSHWTVLPAHAFPASLSLTDLRSTAGGYVAVGRWTNGDGVGAAASLWSSDGRHWPGAPTLLPVPRSAGQSIGSVVGSLAMGSHGMVAVGRLLTSPGAVLWWRSTDGRHWSALPTFAPLGLAPCSARACGGQADGTLAADGRSLVAVRGGRDAAAWVSTDGRSWRRLIVSGDLPDLDANAATVLPGGVLLTNGPITWFGQAMIR